MFLWTNLKDIVISDCKMREANSIHLNIEQQETL